MRKIARSSAIRENEKQFQRLFSSFVTSLSLFLSLFHSFCPIQMTKTTRIGLLSRAFITSLNSKLAPYEFKILSRSKPNQACCPFEFRPAKAECLFKMSPSLVLHWIIQVDTFLALLNNLSSLLTGRCKKAWKFHVPELVCCELTRKGEPNSSSDCSRAEHKALPERSGNVHSWWCLEGGGDI